MRFLKRTYTTTIIFLISPLLSFPLIFRRLKRKKDQGMLFLIAFFIGMLSFSFIPHVTNDKAIYFTRYQAFLDYSFNDFLIHLALTKRPDFIFEFLNFSWAKIGLNINYLFLLITTFTVLSVLVFVQKVITNSFNALNFRYSTLYLAIVLTTFSVPGLLSGIRYTFAGSIFVWGIYFLFHKKKYTYTFIIFLLTIATHYSYSLFVAIALFVYFLQKWSINYIFLKILLLLSFGFYFIPKDFLLYTFSFLEFSEGYSNKVEVYTSSEKELTAGGALLTQINNLWFYVATVFLVFYKEKDRHWFYPLVVFMLIALNFISFIPTAFNRYIGTFSLFFMLYIFYTYFANKNLRSLKRLLFFFLLFSFKTLTNIYIMRDNFIASYSLLDLLTSYKIFMGGITLNDFIN